MTIGLVYFTDDPHKRVFRRVYPLPWETLSVLDDVQWLTLGLDGKRPVAMDKAPDASGRFRGTPWTPASEPIVYLIGLDTITNQNQYNQAISFIGYDSTWANIIPTTAAALPSPLTSPTWVAAINTTIASLGAPTRTTTIAGNTVNVWQV